AVAALRHLALEPGDRALGRLGVGGVVRGGEHLRQEPDAARVARDRVVAVGDLILDGEVLVVEEALLVDVAQEILAALLRRRAQPGRGDRGVALDVAARRRQRVAGLGRRLDALVGAEAEEALLAAGPARRGRAQAVGQHAQD